jgi:LacI family transcriptional regulator
VVAGAPGRGLDVPRDLSVVGFDDTMTATTVWPELTTIRQPIAAMAEAALNLVLRRVRQKKGGEAIEPVDHLFAHELIRRASDAPPPREG